jgi:hypothetical protein
MSRGYNLYNLVARVDSRKYFRKGDTISVYGENYSVFDIKVINIWGAGRIDSKIEMEFYCLSDSRKIPLVLFQSSQIDNFVRTRNLLIEKFRKNNI